MKNILALITVLFCSITAFSQPQIEWDKTFGDKKNQNAYSIVQTKDYGFAITAGNNFLVADKMWMILTNNNGSVAKQQEIKSVWISRQSNSITDQNHNYVAMGFGNTGSEQNSSIAFVKTSRDFTNTQILNFNLQGQVFPAAFSGLSDGNYIFAGNLQKNDLNYDLIAVKLNSSFKPIGQYRYPADSSLWINRVIETSQNKIVYVGMFQRNQSSAADIYVLCTDNLGRIVWEKNLGGASYDEGVDICEVEGSLYVLGTTSSEGAGWNDFVVYKLNSSGDVEWSKTYGGSRNDDAKRILPAANGFYLLGSTKSKGAGNYDFYLINIDKYGNQLWDATYGGSLDDKAVDLVETFDNGLAIVGTTESKGAGKRDVWLVKLKFSIRQQAQQYIESQLASWQQKGKYEKNEDYLKRVNYYTRQQKIFELTNEFFGKIGNPIFEKDRKNARLEYDTESEVFKISLTYFNALYIPVAIADAPAFEENFANLQFTDIRYNLTSQDKLEVYQATIYNPNNKKTYFYDASKPVVFNNNTIVPDFKPIDIPTTQDTENQIVVDGNADVDNNIPVIAKTYSNRYALIIGNANYIQNGSDMVDIRFSINDARIFKKYASNVLGIAESNIFYIEDANATYMRLYIDNFLKLIELKPDGSEFYLYYSGHGSQNDKQEAFLVPVGVKSDYLEQFGIKLSELYSKIKPGDNKKVFIFLDACFSGGGKTGQLLVNAKTGVYRPSRVESINPNVVVFAASSDKQISQEYIPKQHGLFTYFLFKNLKDTRGQITYGDLFKLIFDNVTSTALNPTNKLNNQTPQVNTNSLTAEKWKTWKVNP